MPEILVTIPAYNEQETIGKVIRDFHKELDGKDYSIIVVDDGSTDNTELEAEMAGAKVFYKKHSGLADSFRYEMQIAVAMNPGIIIHADADGQYIARDARQLIRAIRNGSDLVLGSRLRGRIESMPKSKRSTNILGTLLIRLWTRSDVSDATTGFRAFTPNIARLPLHSDYTYTIEQILRTKRAGYKIKSVPIRFLKRTGGESRLMSSPIHYIWKTILNTRRMLG